VNKPGKMSTKCKKIMFGCTSRKELTGKRQAALQSVGLPNTGSREKDVNKVGGRGKMELQGNTFNGLKESANRSTAREKGTKGEGKAGAECRNAP